MLLATPGAEAVAQPTQGDGTAPNGPSATPADGMHVDVAPSAPIAPVAACAATADAASLAADAAVARVASAAAAAHTASPPAESSPGATAASVPVQDRGDTDAAGITASSTNIDGLTDGLTEADLTFEADETTAIQVAGDAHGSVSAFDAAMKEAAESAPAAPAVAPATTAESAPAAPAVAPATTQAPPAVASSALFLPRHLANVLDTYWEVFKGFDPAASWTKHPARTQTGATSIPGPVTSTIDSGDLNNDAVEQAVELLMMLRVLPQLPRDRAAGLHASEWSRLHSKSESAQYPGDLGELLSGDDHVTIKSALMSLLRVGESGFSQLTGNGAHQPVVVTDDGVARLFEHALHFSLYSKNSNLAQTQAKAHVKTKTWTKASGQHHFI